MLFVLVEEDAGNLAAEEDAPASRVVPPWLASWTPHLLRTTASSTETGIEALHGGDGVVDLDGGGVGDLEGWSRGTKRGSKATEGESRGTEGGAGERSGDDGESPPGMAAAAIAMERCRS
jgi:hypothetical protein